MALRVANTQGQWQNVVKSAYGRKQLVNYDAACTLIREKLNLLPKFKHTTLIEAYPGPGVWGAALNNILEPKRHVVLEPHPQCFKHMKALQTTQNGLTPVGADPYRWKTFTELFDDKVIDRIPHPRTEVTPHYLYTANLTMTQGEQLATQYLNCITNQSWLQKLGRVKLLLWVKQSTATKLRYGQGEQKRSRVSIQAEACTTTRIITGVNPSKQQLQTIEGAPELSKHDFFPERADPPVLIEMDPKEHMPKHLDAFEYVIKMLFILRAKPLHEAVVLLGPGAVHDLGPQLSDLMKKKPCDLSLDEIDRVVEVFHNWPFKPDILHDFYTQEDGGTAGFAM